MLGATPPPTPGHIASRPPAPRPVHPSPRRARAALGSMLVIAGSLAVVSVLHLTHVISGGGQNGPSAAGTAEAVICVVLLAGARALAGGRPNGRVVARATVIFAIAGFLIGLTFTLGSGDAFDVAYHLAGLTALVGTLALLGRRAGTPSRGAGPPGPR